MNLKSTDLEVIIFPGKNPPEKYLRHYNKAFQCWKESWEEAFKMEMTNENLLHSDCFTRQDEVLAVFHKNSCVGLVFFRVVDFAEGATSLDSYFEHWPPLVVHRLCKGGSKILVVSQFTVSLDHRQLIDGINPRDLLIGLSYENFSRFNCDAAASAVRIEKKMNRSVNVVGATVLMSNMPYSYDQRVDLIGFMKDKIHPSTIPGIPELSKKLMASATILAQSNSSFKKPEWSKMSMNLKKSLAAIGKLSETYPWHDPYAYGLYLAQTYYYVSHSTQLLALSAGIMKSGDMPFHRRFLEHAAEEKGHEVMLLNDLKKLGYELSDFPELHETRMFWEPQFYKIQHVDPLTVMGYIIALEALASEQCTKLKSVLEKCHPEGSYTFIKVHGEDDPEHVGKAMQVIMSLPVERQKHIEENFYQSIVSYQNLVSRLVEELEKKKSLKAA